MNKKKFKYVYNLISKLEIQIIKLNNYKIKTKFHKTKSLKNLAKYDSYYSKQFHLDSMQHFLDAWIYFNNVSAVASITFLDSIIQNKLLPKY